MVYVISVRVVLETYIRKVLHAFGEEESIVVYEFEKECVVGRGLGVDGVVGSASWGVLYRGSAGRVGEGYEWGPFFAGD